MLTEMKRMPVSAINGGKAGRMSFLNIKSSEWPCCVAMGSYVFTCATTNDDVKAEYTFGYKRNETGSTNFPSHLFRINIGA